MFRVCNILITADNCQLNRVFLDIINLSRCDFIVSLAFIRRVPPCFSADRESRSPVDRRLADMKFEFDFCRRFCSTKI